MFKIEKNIPISSRQAYPFEEMEPGDSFFVPADSDQKINVIRAQIHHYKKDYPRKNIKTRKENAGLRVWLISKG